MLQGITCWHPGCKRLLVCLRAAQLQLSLLLQLLVDSPMHASSAAHLVPTIHQPIAVMRGCRRLQMPAIMQWYVTILRDTLHAHGDVASCMASSV